MRLSRTFKCFLPGFINLKESCKALVFRLLRDFHCYSRLLRNFSRHSRTLARELTFTKPERPSKAFYDAPFQQKVMLALPFKAS